MKDPKQIWAGKARVIRDQLAIVRQAVANVAQDRGMKRAILISGPAGVGKNHLVSEVLKQHGRKPMIANPRSNPGLIEALFEANQHRLIQCDECNDVWHKDMLETWKKSLDPVEANRVVVLNLKGRRNEEKSHLDGKPFKVSCRVIFMTNNQLNDPSQWNVSIRHRLAPIVSRCDTYLISFDRLDCWEYTCYLVVIEDLLKNLGYKLVEVNQALAYFTQNLWKDEDASPRRILSIAETIRNHPSNWQAVLNMRLPPRSTWIAGRVPPIPHIIPPKVVQSQSQAQAQAQAQIQAHGAKVARAWQRRLAKLVKQPGKTP